MPGADNLIRNIMHTSGKRNLPANAFTPERAQELSLARAKKNSVSSHKIAQTLRDFAIQAMRESGDKLVKQGEVESDDGGCVAYMKWLATHPKWTPCFVNLLVKLTPPVKEVRLEGEITIENVVKASYQRLGIPQAANG